MLFSGRAEVCEWFDDILQCFRIEVIVKNRWWGRLFGYTGSFQVEWKQAQTPPAVAFPKRTESRE
jgi:hypothetical protein